MVWAGSHFFGVGKSSIILLAVEGEAIGTITVGGMVFTAYVLNRPQKAPDAGPEGSLQSGAVTPAASGKIVEKGYVPR